MRLTNHSSVISDFENNQLFVGGLYFNDGGCHSYIYLPEVFVDSSDDLFSIVESDIVAQSIRGLYSIVGSLPEGAYSLEIASGVIGALSGAFLAILSNWLFARRTRLLNKQRHYSTSMIGILTNFEEACTNYWKWDKNNFNADEMGG